MNAAINMKSLFMRLDEHRGSFPDSLVAEIIARRDEAVPALLEILESVERDPRPWVVDEDRMLHIYAMYLLAFFRETRAYEPLVRIFSRPGEFAFNLAGDVVTQDLGRILASVSGGDTRGITSLIENEQANEFVRGVAVDGIVSLVQARTITRNEAMAYFLGLFNKLERLPGEQWVSLASACADIWPEEAMQELKRAYADGLVDPDCIEWQDIEDALREGKEKAMFASRRRTPLITDVNEAMNWMQCFQEPGKDESLFSDDDDVLDEDILSDDELDDLLEDEIVNAIVDKYASGPVPHSFLKVGRNDLCPCGSGKKYKKCCLPN